MKARSNTTTDWRKHTTGQWLRLQSGHVLVITLRRGYKRAGLRRRDYMAQVDGVEVEHARSTNLQRTRALLDSHILAVLLSGECIWCPSHQWEANRRIYNDHWRDQGREV